MTHRRRGIVQVVDSDNEEDSEPASLQNIETYLSKLTAEFSALKDELRALREKNEQLEETVEAARDQAETSRRRGGRVGRNADSNKELEDEINDLKAQNRRKERVIKKMKEREVKREARDLLDTHPDPETGEDPSQRMRKLLRRFNDLMLKTTLGEGDNCPICFERMKCDECFAFACQHLVCNDCFKRILPKDEDYPCPECRQLTPRDEMETVYMTEDERWDKLLAVAQAWSAVDHRPEIDTSEEENEDAFLVPDVDEGNATSSSASSVGDETRSEEHASEDNGEGGDEMVTQDHTEENDAADSHAGTSTPPRQKRARSYSESPTKEKRKRLKELAEQRARKRSR